MQTESTIKLTDRQHEILYWASRGKTSWSIGKILGISENTVQYHFKNILSMFAVSSRQEAIARAIRMQLIE